MKILWFLEFILLLAAAPLLPGIINKIKAFFAGRKGPSIFQLYYDLAKLSRKSGVISATSGGVIKTAPAVIVASVIVAALFLPFGGISSPVAFTGDAVLFFYILALGRVAGVLAALDTGSSFEGMGASREVQFSALVEPVVMVIVGFLALWIGNENFSLSGIPRAVVPGHYVASGMVIVAFFIVLLAENCRVPVDDPDTHLELTMIHEAMILDYAGPDLALILYGASLKMSVFAAFFAMLVLPLVPVSGFLAEWLVFAAVVLAVPVVIGIIESSMARYRFLKVPQFLAGALALALLGLVFFIFFEGGII